MTPILHTSKNCTFCEDVRTYAQFAKVTLEENNLDANNPHGIRSAPVIEHDGDFHHGLDRCAAFLRREAKRAA